MELKDLLIKFAESSASLFYGSGITLDNGGPGGKELLRELKEHFGDNKSIDLFEYNTDLINDDIDKRRKVEKHINEYLKTLHYNVDFKYLVSLPWRTILTTNYDHIPNIIAKTLDKNRDIETIIDEDNIDTRTKNKLYVVKIFGDMERIYREKGYMILTNKDKKRDESRNKYLFNIFNDLNLDGSVIYLGYSFEDNLVFDILDDVEHYITKPWKGYAILQKEPKGEISEKLKKHNIEWVHGNYISFISEAKNIFGEIPISSNLEEKNLKINNININLSKNSRINCRDHVSLISQENLNPISLNPKLFFEGIDNTYYPFVKQWDIPRKSIMISNKLKNSKITLDNPQFIKDRLKNTNDEENIRIAIIGPSGSGKTIFTKRFAYDWYINGGIPIFLKQNQILDIKALQILFEEIQAIYQKKIEFLPIEQKTIKFLLIADNCEVYFADIIDLHNFLSAEGYLVDLLITGTEQKLRKNDLNQGEIDAVFTLSDEVRNNYMELMNHFDSIKLFYPKEILLNNIKNPKINNSLFALLYTTLHYSQKPLENVIIEEYNTLNQQEKEIYGIISLLQSINLEPYITLISKYMRYDNDTLKKSIFEGKLQGLLYIQNECIYTRQLIISEIIQKNHFQRNHQLYKCINKLFLSFTLGNIAEEKVIHNLLINKIEKEIIFNKIISLDKMRVRKFLKSW